MLKEKTIKMYDVPLYVVASIESKEVHILSVEVDGHNILEMLSENTIRRLELEF